MVALSFAVVFNICGFLNISHAIPYAAAPFVALILIQHAGAPIWMSCLLGVVVSGIIGLLLMSALIAPLERRAATPMILLLASLGINTVFENVLSLACGDDPQSLLMGSSSQVLTLCGARVTVWQLAIVGFAVMFTVVASVASNTMRLGVAYRAVACDSELARICGVPYEKVRFYSFLIGSLVAGISGVLVSLDTTLHPRMGLEALLMAIVVVIVGGSRSIVGLVLASALLSAGQILGVWPTSSSWQNAVAFALLFVVLMFRPQGVLGQSTRRGYCSR